MLAMPGASPTRAKRASRRPSAPAGNFRQPRIVGHARHAATWRSVARARRDGGPAGRFGERPAPRQLASQGYARQKRRIGQGRQSGFRAVHQVAPKSIRAWLKS